MTDYIDISLNMAEQEDGAVDSGSSAPWMIIEQDEIPAEQEQLTEQDAKSMLDAAISGQSAFSGLSSCPVTSHSLGTGRHYATYKAVLLIHKSTQIDDYDLIITKDGDPLGHSMPRIEYRRKSQSYNIDYTETAQLGWQPHSVFIGIWNPGAGVFDTNSSRMFVKPDIEQYDGFLTLKGDLAFGTVDVTAIAIMDYVVVDIEHQLGTQWGSTVRAQVRWPAGVDPEYQDEANCEILLPDCVKSAFNDCAALDSMGDPISGVSIPPGMTVGDGNGGYFGSYFKHNPGGPTVVTWNRCTRRVIGVSR